MKLSRRVAHFNKVANNRVQRIYAWLLPPWLVIEHRGRRSGRPYRTPVLAFTPENSVVIPLLYGRESDWWRNLSAAGGGHIVRKGRRFVISHPEVVPTGAAAELSSLPSPAAAYCRLADEQVVAQIVERLPGFGPHRTAVAAEDSGRQNGPHPPKLRQAMRPEPGRRGNR